MSISFVILMAAGLALAPWRSYLVFQKAIAWQERQIALDNAAIRLGKEDRETFRYLGSINRLLRGLEALHHPLHVCARIPKSAPVCRPKDVAIEAKIRALHRQAYVIAQARWRGNGARALGELADQNLSRFSRRVAVPIKKVQCPFCHLDVYWDAEGEAASRTEFRSLTPRPLAAGARIVGAALLESRPGNYRLEEPQ